MELYKYTHWLHLLSENSSVAFSVEGKISHESKFNLII